jgi:hypothetical protein
MGVVFNDLGNTNLDSTRQIEYGRWSTADGGQQTDENNF